MLLLKKKQLLHHQKLQQARQLRSKIISTSSAIKLIVGLRNPGLAYAQTRHNVGAWFVEALAKMANGSFKPDKKLRGELLTTSYYHVTCMLFLPLSFMNLNGECVRAVCQFYRILPHEILVVHDDLDLPVGTIRLKTGGGHGGHNGLRDMITQLGSATFHRLRVGIGHPGQRELVTDYVLGRPIERDRQLINDALLRAIDVMPLLLNGDIAKAMNRLNTEG